MSAYQTFPYQRIINALNEWRAACGLSLLTDEVDANGIAEVTEKLVADWQRIDKACQDAYQQANHARAELAAARQDANAYSAHLDEIDIALDNHNVQALSPDESIAAIIERVLVDYDKERQRRKAAEDDAAAWQAQHRGIASQLQYQERRADALQDKLSALNDELNGVVAARNELHNENSALRSELAEARTSRGMEHARAETYAASLVKLNDVLVQAKVGAPGDDCNIADIVRTLVAERDAARYHATSWETNVLKTRQALEWAQADAAKWQAKYEDMADTLHGMVKLYLTKGA